MAHLEVPITESNNLIPFRRELGVYNPSSCATFTLVIVNLCLLFNIVDLYEWRRGEIEQNKITLSLTYSRYLPPSLPLIRTSHSATNNKHKS